MDQAQRLTEKEAVFQRALEATEPLHIEAGEQIWLLIDLEDYFCGYPEITVEGGAGSSIKLLWAESLFEESVSIGSLRRQRKGNRNEIMEKFMIGRGDFFRVGEREEPSSFSSLWWSCGRYVALLLETGSEPLKITYLGFRDSRYPFELAASIQLGNDDFERSKALMWRSLQMCSHETYMDCPYYEQLNYAGDTRVQALVTYVTSGDDRLARKCIALLAHSALPNGLVQARYPCWTSQAIPQFSLYWVGLLHDFAAWRGDSAFLKPFLPQARSIIDTFLNHVAQDGLLRCPHGWDWIDWNPSWTGGRHHQGPEGASSVNHLQLIYAIRQAAQLERWVGRASFAEDLDASCRELWDRAVKAFWNEGRGLFAATTTHEHFGEHAQCFAVLSGLMDQDSKERMATSLVESTDLVRASYYFRFYLFEACASLGRLDHVLRLFGSWGEMADLGLKTTIESMEPSRSDCHAWSSHPLYHAVTSFGGIRPDGFGFNRVRISPAVDVLDSANICMPHPQGDLRVRWSRRGSDLTVEVSLPEGLDGTIELDRHHHPLTAGPAKFEVNRGVINRLG